MLLDEIPCNNKVFGDNRFGVILYIMCMDSILYCAIAFDRRLYFLTLIYENIKYPVESLPSVVGLYIVVLKAVKL